MISQREVSKLAFRLKISDRVIEKDYVITWILLTLADSDLKHSLAFKGGTAIKKMYFPDYRYSEDLDFTVIQELKPEQIIADLTHILKQLAKNQGFQFDIPKNRIEKRQDSLTVYVNFIGPLQAKLSSRDIKVDFTLSEKIIFPLTNRFVNTSYSDSKDIEKKRIPSYSLEETLVEKLCAIIGRTEPRDLFDAAYLLNLQDLDFLMIPDTFCEKAKFKAIDPGRLKDVLIKKEAVYARMWKNRLEHQITDLPPIDGVLRDLKRNIRKYIDL